MIQLKNVSRRYRQGENLVVALDRVTLQIAEHEFAAVTGESGSGKSTMLHLLGGLDRPDEGEIWVNGISIGNAPEKELTRYRREQLGIVFQFFNLLPTLTVMENVALPLQLLHQPLRAAEARARELLELVGLTKRSGHFTHQLSGGEMQRAAVARALAHRPHLLLADEPTGNLDEANADRVMDLFGAIHEQRLTTLVVVTHSPEVAARARRVVRLRGGKVEADGVEVAGRTHPS